MCYYNGVKVSRSTNIRLKGLEKLVANYDFLNISLYRGPEDYPNVPILKRVEGENDFEIIKQEWGFLPPYLKNRQAVEEFRRDHYDLNGKFVKGITTLNARSENLFNNEKGNASIYRFAAMERRCIFLSTGFYEWRDVFPMGQRGKPLKTALKIPYYISLKDDEYFFMAGIYNPWVDKDTREFAETSAIVTAPANFIMSHVHNSKKRMPTILTQELAWKWLFDDLNKDDVQKIGGFQFDSEKMQAHTVRKNFKESLNPSEYFEYENIPPLFSTDQQNGQLSISF
jgi:putative SOS response-associated peptidase YedK